MRKLQLVLVAAMLAGTASVSSAQDAQQQAAPPQGRPNMMATLLQGITLTAEQQTTQAVDSTAPQTIAQWQETGNVRGRPPTNPTNPPVHTIQP